MKTRCSLLGISLLCFVVLIAPPRLNAAAPKPAAKPAGKAAAKPIKDTEAKTAFEQQLQGLEGKVDTLKKDDGKMLASDKMKDEDRVALIKDINDGVADLAKSIAADTKGKKLSEAHGKALSARATQLKSFMEERAKKEKEKAKRAPLAAPPAPAAPASAAPTTPATPAASTPAEPTASPAPATPADAAPTETPAPSGPPAASSGDGSSPGS